MCSCERRAYEAAYNAALRVLGEPAAGVAAGIHMELARSVLRGESSPALVELRLKLLALLNKAERSKRQHDLEERRCEERERAGRWPFGQLEVGPLYGSPGIAPAPAPGGAPSAIHTI